MCTCLIRVLIFLNFGVVRLSVGLLFLLCGFIRVLVSYCWHRTVCGIVGVFLFRWWLLFLLDAGYCLAHCFFSVQHNGDAFFCWPSRHTQTGIGHSSPHTGVDRVQTGLQAGNSAGVKPQPGRSRSSHDNDFMEYQSRKLTNAEAERDQRASTAR